MAEYINREEAIKELREVYENEYPTASGDFDEYASHDVPNVLKNMPAADVQPVKRGRWKKKRGYLVCSNCGMAVDTIGYTYEEQEEVFRYCPCCGYRMDGEQND